MKSQRAKDATCILPAMHKTYSDVQHVLFERMSSQLRGVRSRARLTNPVRPINILIKIVQPSGFILHHPVGICITPCRRCVRTNIRQRRKYTSGNTNADVDAVFAAAVETVQHPRICGRRQVLSAIMTLFRVYALPLQTAIPQFPSRRCFQAPSWTLFAVSELHKLTCQEMSRSFTIQALRGCAEGRVVDSRPNNVTETPVR